MSFQFSYSFHQSHLKVLSSSGQSAGHLEYLWSMKSCKPCKHVSSLNHPRQDLLEVESIFEAPDPSADAAPPRLFHKALDNWKRECRECGLLHGVSYSIELQRPLVLLWMWAKVELRPVAWLCGFVLAELCFQNHQSMAAWQMQRCQWCCTRCRWWWLCGSNAMPGAWCSVKSKSAAVQHSCFARIFGVYARENR